MERGISQSHYESTDIFHHVMRTGLPPRGVRKMQVCHYSTLNFSIQNSIIVGYSQENSVLESISSLGKNGQNHWCAHTIPCNKTSKSREAISAGKLEFLRLYIRYNHEIKTLMHFGTLAFGVHRNFVDIGGWKRGISQSHYESTDIFYHVMRTEIITSGKLVWWEQDYPSMGVRKMQVCHYSSLNFSIQNSIIVGYSQENTVLESISSLEKKLKITDVPIQSLVIKLRRAGKQSRQEILNFSGYR